MASRYKCRVTFEYDDVSANAKSVLSVLGACIKMGTRSTLVCEGEDEEEAMAAMLEAVRDGLGNDC